MKRFRVVSAMIVAGTLAACSMDSVGPEAAAPRAPVHNSAAAEGQYLVTFEDGIPAGFARQVEALGGTVLYSHAKVGFAAVAGLDDAAAAQLGAIAGVTGVGVDEVIQANLGPSMEADFEDVAASQSNPTTATRYNFQWNMRQINAHKAWAAGKLGSPNITVAILDTGLDYDINDLVGLVDLSRSVSFIPGDNTLTATYFPSRHPVNDYNGHGTNVATQVSSKAFALAGVTSRTTLIGVKVLSRTGSGPLSAVLAGITWAADHDADVANMSLGGGFAKAGNGQYVSLINKTFNYAKQKGMLIVTSAGNETMDLDHNGNFIKTYCDMPHVLCVSSVGPEVFGGNGDIPAYYTNFGRSAISVAAPGGNAGTVNTTWPWGVGNASWVWSYCPKYRVAGLTATGAPVLTTCLTGTRLSGVIGTSQASPHVAGLAALVMAEFGTNAVQTRHRILSTAVDLGTTGTDPYFGRGRIDVARTLGL